MKRSLRIAPWTAVLLILVFAACATIKPDLDRDRRPVTRKAIGVLANHETGGAEVNPYYAFTRRTHRVEWYSPDGELDIQFQPVQAPLRPIDDPQCHPRGCGGYCFVVIDRDQPAGNYPYFAFVTAPDKRQFKANQPELIIRGWTTMDKAPN